MKFESTETDLSLIFEDKSDVTEVPEGTYGRNELVLKPKSVEELMFYTTDDE